MLRCARRTAGHVSLPESPVKEPPPSGQRMGWFGGEPLRVGRMSGPRTAYVTMTTVGSMTLKCQPG